MIMNDRRGKRPEQPVGAAAAFPIVIIMALLMFLSALVLPSAEYRMEVEVEQVVQNRDISADYTLGVSRYVSNALGDVYAMPKVYTLPWEDVPVPVPNEACYKVLENNGEYDTYKNTDVLCYEDETIRTVMWKEKIGESVYNFADVTIAHPTQFRRLFADKYGTSTRFKPLTLAKKANAVVAMSGDFYNYRQCGYIIYQRKLYLNYPRSLDICLIDSNGDLHCIYGQDIEKSGIMDEYDIVFSLSFGPTLVQDGKLRPKKDFNYYLLGQIDTIEPRAAIGQLGPLHYLLCTVDGRMEGTRGEYAYTVGEVMEQKKCITAYTLDGGQTATMIFHNEVYNRVAYGGQREVSDIIYFATAIPNEEAAGRTE